MVRVELEDVHLTFHLRSRGASSFKDWVLSKIIGRKGPPERRVEALNGINLQIADGERLGIVGHNGAGKSSLLRLLAGVYEPTAGRRTVRGKVSSLFELTLGFEPDATGYENIRYRGYLQKETPASLKNKISDIAEFTELGDALNMPIRYYSSGMIVRLAFAIATAIEPEILLIDEVLAAGDMHFQERARQRIRGLMQKARAMVVVSHDLPNLIQLTTRMAWLEHGRVRLDGEPNHVIHHYCTHMQSITAAAAAA